ncbi:MAG: stage 0 sporulation protein [Erysipelotrichaceae bacterium]|nr:stage 0 sporulation protein [Erysipelotrichaceae bacterium]
MEELVNNTNEEIKEDTPQEQIKYDYYVAIKMNASAKAYFFSTNISDLKIGEYVVIETVRGLELGKVDTEVLPMEKYKLTLELKPIIRRASEEDIANAKENLTLAQNALEICTREVKNLNLDMRLITCEYTLDRSKVIFSYLADNRVDFRELLKVLAAQLHCRIELRQIGTRDKAKIVGGIGICGLPLCCSTFLNEFDGISINRAKNQMLSLNIPKLSGHCGKLICCLKYEDDAYTELKEGYPRLGTRIIYNNEQFKITSMNVLTRQIKLENSETVVFVDLDVVKKCMKDNKYNEK